MQAEPLVPPFVPDDDFIAAVRTGVRSHRRRTRNRLTAGLAFVALLAGTGVWYANDRLSSVERIELGVDPTLPDPVVRATPFNVLVLGLDRCERADDAVCADRLTLAPDGPPASADTIAVLRVDPGSRTVDMLSIPRDLIADRTSKWSSSTVEQIRTHLHDDLGIDVAHAVTITMSSFRDLADDLAFRLSIDTAVRDRGTGLDLEPGCTTVDGRQLLALVRSRHLQYRDGGTWASDPTGDIGRMARQQQVLRAVFAQVRSLRLDDLGTLDRLLNAIAVDDGLSNTELLRLGGMLRSATLRSTATLPVVSGGDRSTSFLVIDPDAAGEAIARFGGHLSAEPTAPSSTVSPGMQEQIDGMVGWAGISSC